MIGYNTKGIIKKFKQYIFRGNESWVLTLCETCAKDKRENWLFYRLRDHKMDKVNEGKYNGN